MVSGIVTFIVGIVVIVIGMKNRNGNISMLHSYHIKNVKEEDKLPFGKLIGLGMYIVGVTLIIGGIILLIEEYSYNEVLSTVSMVIYIVGFTIGFIIMFYALKKYNKGIF